MGTKGEPGPLERLPMVGRGMGDRSARRDLAKGSRLLVFWGGPVALLLAGPTLVATLGGPPRLGNGVLVLGTAWLGGMCLINAARCGRVHCWTDGALLPPLAAVGTIGLVGPTWLPWDLYGGVLAAIVVAGFLLECALGPYRPRRGPRPGAPSRPGTPHR